MCDLGSDAYPDVGHDAYARVYVLRDVCAGLAQLSTPITTPPAIRYVKRGDYMICTTCQLAKEWCGCAKQRPAPDAPSADDLRAESQLVTRIRECAGGR